MVQVTRKLDTLTMLNSPLKRLKQKAKRSVQHMSTQLMDSVTFWKLSRKLRKRAYQIYRRKKIAVDSPHKALNYLLQSGAGVIAKRWMVINQDTMRQTKLCASQVGFIHDELQFECDPTHVNDLCSSLVYSATAAGEYYNMRIKIEAESTSGPDWSATH